MPSDRPDDTESEDEFVRLIVFNAIWDVIHHEERLTKAMSDLAFAKEMMDTLNIDIKSERGEYDDDTDDVIFENMEQFALSAYDHAVHHAEYYEHKLAQTHKKLAFVKMIIMRGKYPFTFKDVEEQVAVYIQKREEEE